MKKFALMFALAVSVVSIAITSKVHAQSPSADSAVTAKTPVLTGNEKNLVDSLHTVQQNVSNEDISAVVNRAETVIKSFPKSGSDVNVYIAWGAVVLTFIASAIAYVRGKFIGTKQATNNPPASS